jgi:hypothetical protein
LLFLATVLVSGTFLPAAKIQWTTINGLLLLFFFRPAVANDGFIRSFRGYDSMFEPLCVSEFFFPRTTTSPTKQEEEARGGYCTLRIGWVKEGSGRQDNK